MEWTSLYGCDAVELVETNEAYSKLTVLRVAGRLAWYSNAYRTMDL